MGKIRIKLPRKVDLQAITRDLARVPSRVSTKGARALRRELRTTWYASKDPYGSAWVPLAPATLAKGRRPPILLETGLLFASTEFRPRKGAGILMRFRLPRLAGLHQRGTRHMPRRPVAPSRGRGGMPQAWRQQLQRLTRLEFGKI